MSAHPELRARMLAGDGAARLQLMQRLVASYDEAQTKEAMQLLSAACEQGDTKALLLHAVLAARGLGRGQDFNEAVALVARAAELGDTSAAAQLAVLGGKFDRDIWFSPLQLRSHHGAPRIFTVSKFLPQAVCNWFMQDARGRLAPAMVRDLETGEKILHSSRTATFALTGGLAPDLIAQLVNLRIAGATQTHVGQQEQTSFIHYGIGEEYQPHYDFEDEVTAADQIKRIGQRIATVLVYLNEGYEGGETHFPRLNMAFKGKPGDALIFWNVSAKGVPERNSLHAGLPVTSGEKWLLSKWVRARPVPLV